MNKELDNAFIDVRNAFRLLYRYQSRVLDIVGYIREHTLYTDMWGKPRNIIDRNLSLFKQKKCEDNYAPLDPYISNPFHYLYGYLFEFYFGEREIDNRMVAMSIIEVSDDGYKNNDEFMDFDKYNPSNSSNSYFIFTVGCGIWLGRDTSQPGDGEEDYAKYLVNILKDSKDYDVIKPDDNHWCITKRYPMQLFSSQKETDKVLADFGKIVRDNVGIDLFKNK